MFLRDFRSSLKRFPAIAANRKNDCRSQSERSVFSKAKKKLDICSYVESCSMKMPIIGLGTWQSSPDEVRGAVQDALEAGYKHIDTAYQYKNEAAIGHELKRAFDRGICNRNDVFVVSKLPSSGMSPDKIKKYLYKTLQDLQLCYLDLYLIHFPVGVIKNEATQEKKPDPNTCHSLIWQALENEVAAGYVKALGLSNFNVQQIGNILSVARIPPTNLQIEMHVYCQQKELLTYCQCNNITVTAYAPLGSPGLGKYLAAKYGDKGSDCKKLTPLTDPNVCTIANKCQVLPSQVLLRYLLQLGVAVIPKSVTCSRIKSNINLFNFELDKCDMTVLSALDRCEEGRMFHSNVWRSLDCHPEFPFPKKA